MCLTTTHKFPKIATKDIVVYKELEYSSYAKAYRTPIIGEWVPENNILKASEDAFTVFSTNLFCNNIREGVIHCFKSANSGHYGKNTIICEAIIPKGTEYVSGYYFGSLNYPSIASKKLVYLPDSVKTFN